MDHSLRERKSSSIYSVQYDVQFDNSEDYSSSVQNTLVDQIHAECFGECENYDNEFSHKSNSFDSSHNNGFWKSIHSQEQNNQENHIFQSLLAKNEIQNEIEDEWEYSEDMSIHGLIIGHPGTENKTEQLENHELLNDKNQHIDRQYQQDDDCSSDAHSYYEFEPKHQSCFQFMKSWSTIIDNAQKKLEETKNNYKFKSNHDSQLHSGKI